MIQTRLILPLPFKMCAYPLYVQILPHLCTGNAYHSTDYRLQLYNDLFRGEVPRDVHGLGHCPQQICEFPYGGESIVFLTVFNLRLLDYTRTVLSFHRRGGHIYIIIYHKHQGERWTMMDGTISTRCESGWQSCHCMHTLCRHLITPSSRIWYICVGLICFWFGHIWVWLRGKSTNLLGKQTVTSDHCVMSDLHCSIIQDGQGVSALFQLDLLISWAKFQAAHLEFETLKVWLNLHASSLCLVSQTLPLFPVLELDKRGHGLPIIFVDHALYISLTYLCWLCISGFNPSGAQLLALLLEKVPIFCWCSPTQVCGLFGVCWWCWWKPTLL